MLILNAGSIFHLSFSVQFYSILERFTPKLFYLFLPLFPQESLEPNGANELWSSKSAL